MVCVFGTASDVGKSTIATALCAVFRRMGVSVAPFKAQNMSNNSAVTREGLEMGRAQFVQAQAAGVEPHVDMNPVLLKPQAESKSQIVLCGRVVGEVSAREYFRKRPALREPAFAALDRLRQRHRVIVAEGAGSCAEVNLRAREFVNFPVAHHADASVLLVADIERGGVFAQVVGSLEVMPPEDRHRVRGVIINRFRGDPELFVDGRAFLQERTGLPVLGVLPYREQVRVAAEDSVELATLVDPPALSRGRGEVGVAVIRLPRISNFTDFEALGRRVGVRLHYLSAVRSLDPYDLVILPGSKATVSDMRWLRTAGWEQELVRRAERGGKILGVCGGYQMLGARLDDSLGLEGPPAVERGLGLLSTVTHFSRTKRLCRSVGQSDLLGARLRGYEIHIGESAAEEAPLCESVAREPGDSGPDGAVHARRHVVGTYLHGLFDEPLALDGWLAWAAPHAELLPAPPSLEAWQDEFEPLVQHFRRHVDVPALLGAVGLSELP